MATTTATTTPKTAAEALAQIRARKAASSATSTATSTKPKTAAEALVLIRARKAAEEQARLEAEAAAQANKGSFLGNLAKAIIRPVATIAARPIQLGQSLELSARKALFPQNVRPGETQESVQNILPSVAPSIVAPAPQGARDVVKDFGRAAETVALGVGGGGAVQAAKTGFKGVVLPAAKIGAIQGAKAGALGGAGLSLEEGNLNPVKVGVDAATGALGGAAIGGLIGPGASLLRTPPVNPNKVLKYVTPSGADLSGAEFKLLSNKGQIRPGTLFKSSQYVLSPREKEIAIKYANVIKKNPVKTARNIELKIGELSEGVGKFLRQNNAIFNKGELRNSLKKALEDVDDLTIDESRILKAKNDITNRFVEAIEKNDMESLWKARIAFDTQYDKIFRGSPTLKKEIQRKLRDAVQDFIASKTPDGTYKASMRDMSSLYRLQDIVNTKSVKSRGDNIAEWISENPRASTLLTIVGGTILGGTVIPGIVTAGR